MVHLLRPWRARDRRYLRPARIIVPEHCTVIADDVTYCVIPGERSYRQSQLEWIRLGHGAQGSCDRKPEPVRGIRLAKAFGSTTETWIRLQAAYDVAQAADRENQIKVDRYRPATAAQR